ncbi:MAG: aminodeoxychorismate/anthranilate synthase component II [Bacteroidales bacterium]|nr:aminodeoxychorismate/anthranilate synthase component II [Bacteroidales bacterium]
MANENKNLRVLVLDNYDSFVYNLVHYLKEIVGDNGTVDVYRNDEISIADVAKYDKILLSPGPGVPDEAGILKELIKTYGATKSILGVCLGCQAIAEVYGGKIINMKEVYHGVALDTLTTEKDEYLFANLPFIFKSGRYHSWVVEAKSLPDCLTIISRDLDTGMVMGIRHNEHDVRGVQFHPESVLTEGGMQMIRNWIEK